MIRKTFARPVADSANAQFEEALEILQEARRDFLLSLIPLQTMAADLIHEPYGAGKRKAQTSHRNCWGVPQSGNPAAPYWCGLGRALPMVKRNAPRAGTLLPPLSLPKRPWPPLQPCAPPPPILELRRCVEAFRKCERRIDCDPSRRTCFGGAYFWFLRSATSLQ